MNEACTRVQHGDGDLQAAQRVVIDLAFEGKMTETEVSGMQTHGAAGTQSLTELLPRLSSCLSPCELPCKPRACDMFQAFSNLNKIQMLTSMAMRA